MEFYLDISDLRQMENILSQLETALCIGKTVVPTFALEPGITRFLTSLDPSEEGFECKFQTQNHVLEHMRMDLPKLWMIYLEMWKSVLCLKVLDLPLFVLPGILPIGQRIVVDLTIRR